MIEVAIGKRRDLISRDNNGAEIKVKKRCD
jgi:hypothetical protein